MIERVRIWCGDKVWWWRIPFLLFFGVIFYRYLTNKEYASIFDSFNLGIHEFGHLLFSPFGQFLGIAGGTITQCLVPIYGFFNFLRQDDYFSAILCFGWLSTNFFGIAKYADDAQAMALPLVSPFGSEGVIHDWNYLLNHFGILPLHHFVAGCWYAAAVLSMIFCLVIGGLMISQMKVN